MQQNLFQNSQNRMNHKPLADRMRPRTLDEVYGQEHLLGKGRLLRRAIENDALTSCIFFGPAGTGKTTIANIIAGYTKSSFVKINAVTSGVTELRQILKEAENNLLLHNRATYLFLDECHRWSKTQSDSILPAIESGLVKFIGSTTENPSAAMTPAIVSRCRVYRFLPHTPEHIEEALRHALADEERGYGKLRVSVSDEAIAYIASTSGGDFRQALSALEMAVLTAEEKDGVKHIALEDAKECVQTPLIGIDKQLYYDMISALIKSMRGSDSNAAVFWLARLLHSGIDPRIIARRVMVHASEDVGLADPMAMLQAHAAVKAVEFVGMPEARIPLTQAVIAIAEAEKSNSVVEAIDMAMQDAKSGKIVQVPKYLCDHSYAVKGEVYGEYLYPHSYEEHIVQQSYLPEEYADKVYYRPSQQGCEKQIAARQSFRQDLLRNRNKT